MHIGEVELTNFGPIGHVKMVFQNRGIHFVIGSNASGKTYVVHAIFAALFGERANLLSVSDKGTESSARVTLCEDGREERLELIATADREMVFKNTIKSTDPLFGEEAHLRANLARMAFRRHSPCLYWGEAWENRVMGSRYGNEEWLRHAAKGKGGVWLSGIIDKICGNSKTTEEFLFPKMPMASGTSILRCLALECAIRINSPTVLPWIMDRPLSCLDMYCRNQAVDMFRRIAGEEQLIILTAPQTLDSLPIDCGHTVAFLDEHQSEGIGRVSAEYSNLRKCFGSFEATRF